MSASAPVQVQGGSVAAPIMYTGAPVVVQGGSVSAAQFVQGGSVTAAPIVVSSTAPVTTAAPVYVQPQPGMASTLPQYSYTAGSVEVPIYSQNVNAYTLYPTNTVPLASVPAPLQTTYTTTGSGGVGGLTAEQLKMIFPMGAPASFTDAAGPATVIDLQPQAGSLEFQGALTSGTAPIVSAGTPIASLQSAGAIYSAGAIPSVQSVQSVQSTGIIQSVGSVGSPVMSVQAAQMAIASTGSVEVGTVPPSMVSAPIASGSPAAAAPAAPTSAADVSASHLDTTAASSSRKESSKKKSADGKKKKKSVKKSRKGICC